MSLCLNLTTQDVFVLKMQLIGVISLKSANQHRSAFIIMERTINHRAIMLLLAIVLFSLSTGSGANL